MRFAKGCISYVVVPFLIFLLIFIPGVVTGMVLMEALGLLFLLIAAGLVVFFRDPELPIGDGIVSPANGKVFAVDTIDDTRIVRIFMNVWNIHVNRSPMDGVVSEVEHRPGGHIPAFDKDAETNERVIVHYDTSIGKVKTVQIAGSVARRIVPYISGGEKLKKGDKIGIIRLGSRVDVHLPKEKVSITCAIGDVVVPGQTIANIFLDQNLGEGGDT